ELVIRGGLVVVENLAQLCEVAGPQQMIDVGERLLGERGQRYGLDREDVAAHGLLHLHSLGCDLAIRRVVLAERKQRRVLIAGQALGGGDFGVDGHGFHSFAEGKHTQRRSGTTAPTTASNRLKRTPYY